MTPKKTSPRKIALALALQNGVSEAEAQEVVEFVFSRICDTLEAGGTVSLPGLGTLRGIRRPASRKQAFGREVSYGERLAIQFRRTKPARQAPEYQPQPTSLPVAQPEPVREVDTEPKDELDRALADLERKSKEGAKSFVGKQKI